MSRLIDYNELWKLLIRRRGFDPRADVDPVEFWDKRAENYLDTTVSPEDKCHELYLIDVRTGNTVLDVGAGVGRLSVPIAKKCAHVTIVEPSGSMIAHLKRNMEDSGFWNYTIVQKRWEDVLIGSDVHQHDVVISAFSMGVLDAEEALLKLDRAAKRAVYVFWFAGEQDFDGLESWLRQQGIGNGPENGLPDYIHLVNILHQAKIHANIKIMDNEWNAVYPGVDDAVASAIESGLVTPENAGYAKKYYESVMVSGENGECIIPKKKKQAMISWRKD
ncbi:MAG: class I SAM-dependent methyltransferase [Methanomicrobiaceae archaeon]|nr:class I SAM-dependent methyltransferase [Methanomicrobiaceae archaeon]